MAAAQSPVLEPLIANQRAVHGGQPGGLGQAMTAAEREAALLFCQRNKPEKKFIHALSLLTRLVLTILWCCTSSAS